MKKHFILGIMALSALVGCTKSEILHQESLNEKGISFSAYAGKAPVTKTTSIDGDNIGEAGIGILAWRTGISTDITEDYLTNYAPVFMPNYKLTKDNNGDFTYSPMRYWPSTGMNVSFYAYSPYKSLEQNAADNDYHPNNITIGNSANILSDQTTGVGGQHLLTLTVPQDDNGISYANHTDFMVSRKSEENQNLNKDYEGTVNFVMKHALSKISFVAKAGNTSGKYSGAVVKINDLQINGTFAKSGVYDLFNEKWTIDQANTNIHTRYAYVNAENTTNDPFTAVADELYNENAVGDVENMPGWWHLTKTTHDLMVIPFTNTTTPAKINSITGKYTVVTVDENRDPVPGYGNTDEIPFRLDVNIDLKEGKSYIFKLNIELKAINFDVEIEDWENAGTVNVIDNFVQDSYVVTDRKSFDRLPYSYITVKNLKWDEATPATLPWLAVEFRPLSAGSTMEVVVDEVTGTDTNGDITTNIKNFTFTSQGGEEVLTLNKAELGVQNELWGRTFKLVITVTDTEGEKISKTVKITVPTQPVANN